MCSCRKIPLRFLEMFKPLTFNGVKHQTNIDISMVSQYRSLPELKPGKINTLLTTKRQKKLTFMKQIKRIVCRCSFDFFNGLSVRVKLLLISIAQPVLLS